MGRLLVIGDAGDEAHRPHGEGELPDDPDATAGMPERVQPAATPTSVLFDRIEEELKRERLHELLDSWEERVGDKVGEYRLLSKLGKGTFGSVWRAHDEKLGRDVAIKLLLPGRDPSDYLSRFLQEQAFLAQLRHPGIATVFGSGVTDRGRPYFAMEYVKGAPITAFCDRERLGIRDRLKLFIGVCDAVQFAHDNGIAHRDLKPGNVLVEFGVDGEPRPVVIDFGIAKALSPGRVGANDTAGLTPIGTPVYMSPEQASPYGTGVDNRTDVYALGAMLYELISGLKAFEFAEHLRNERWDEIQRILNDVDPPAPSTQLSTVASVDLAAAQAIAAARRQALDELSATLSRELQLIPLKALRKERRERYPSALALAEDIQRYLDGRPVVAMPDSWIYRTRKFVRRHRAKVVVAASTVLLLSVAATATVMERIANAEARQLQAEAALVEARSAALTEQRERLIGIIGPMLSEEWESAAEGARTAEIVAARLRAASAWRSFCERREPAEGDDRSRRELVSDLAVLVDAAIRAAAASSTVRNNAEGAGDRTGREQWMQVATQAVTRMDALGASASDVALPRLRLSRAGVDALAGKRDWEAVFSVGDPLLRSAETTTVTVADGRDRELWEREVGLLRTKVADAISKRCETAVQRLPTGDAIESVARIRTDLAAERRIREAEVARRREVVECAPDAQRRVDLLIAIERLANFHRMLNAYPDPICGDTKSNTSEWIKLVDEYLSIARLVPAAELKPTEVREYASNSVRVATWFDQPVEDGGSEKRVIQLADSAAAALLTVLWRDPGSNRSHLETLKLIQQFLGPARKLDRAWQRRVLSEIERSAVEPARVVAAEMQSQPEIAANVRATRIAIDSRWVLLELDGGDVRDGRRPSQDAALRALRALGEASKVISDFEEGVLPGGLSRVVSSSLMMEARLAGAVALRCGIEGSDEFAGRVSRLWNSEMLQSMREASPATQSVGYELDCAESAGR